MITTPWKGRLVVAVVDREHEHAQRVLAEAGQVRGIDQVGSRKLLGRGRGRGQRGDVFGRDTGGQGERRRRVVSVRVEARKRKRTVGVVAAAAAGDRHDQD